MINIKISGVWTSILRKNEKGEEYLDHTPMNFHILAKDKIREMFAKDPEHNGSALALLEEMDFDERLAICEEGEQLVLNEDFINAMIKDYENAFETYKPGFVEKRVKDKAFTFIKAVYRNDSAYFERIGGIISYIVSNKEKFNDIHADHFVELENVYKWWQSVDNRTRTAPYFDWVFQYVLKKYKTNSFYKKSVNHMIEFIYLNASNWHYHETFYPAKWFGNGRGRQIMELWGGDF